MSGLSAAYDDRFYIGHLHGPDGGARRLGRAVYKVLRPSSAIDIGCAMGQVLEGLREGAGSRAIRLAGAEHPDVVDRILGLPFPSGIPLHAVDLSGHTFLPAGWDLAICTEVGEHLPGEAAAGLIDTVTHCAPTVLWSAATPGQGGTGHVNEQPLEYWQEIFWVRNFTYDPVTTGLVKALAGPMPNEPWYDRVRIYRRR